MNGFLLDENLPIKLQFTPSLTVHHVSELGDSLPDTEIWQHAKQHHWVIVTKDADFSNRFMLEDEPPKIIHLRFGNMKRQDFHAFLADIWPKLEALISDHNLLHVYRDRIEIIG
ncbi:MAG: DUF5615 family PIN-like protein [Pseudomonadota bacterium]